MPQAMIDLLLNPPHPLVPFLGGMVVVAIIASLTKLVKVLRPSKENGASTDVTTLAHLLVRIEKNTREPFNGQTTQISQMLKRIAENTDSMPLLVRSIDEVRSAQGTLHAATHARLEAIERSVAVVKDRTERP